MATNPPNIQLPPPYKSITPLSSQAHGNFGMETNRKSLGFASGMNVVPLLVEEIRDAQRNYPVIFSVGDQCMPLALLGLREGENTFLDADGQWREGAYIPAYIRRYPFVLARLQQGSDEMTLCFDDTSPEIGVGKGTPLFDGTEPTETTKSILGFCEQYEQAAARTRFFVEELQKHDLLMDAEASVQAQGMEQPATFRGFKIVSEEKLRDLRGDQARKLIQNGVLSMAFAHLMSLPLITQLYAKAAEKQAA